MIRIQLDQVPVLLILAVLLLIPLQWLSLHVGLRATLKATPLADRWRVYREFAQGHRLGVGGIILVINIFRKVEGKESLRWTRRDQAARDQF
jgi:hypothetical protein